jgi:hypothetical protein
VPPVAWVPPIANVGDVPFRQSFEVDDEVDASAVGAVNEAPAEDHLAMPVGRANLARCETKRDQDWIEDVGNSVECRIVRWDGVRRERHDRHCRIKGTPGSVAGWRCEYRSADLARPHLRRVGSGDKQSSAKFGRVEINEVAVAFSPPTGREVIAEVVHCPLLSVASDCGPD